MATTNHFGAPADIKMIDSPALPRIAFLLITLVPGHATPAAPHPDADDWPRHKTGISSYAPPTSGANARTRNPLEKNTHASIDGADIGTALCRDEADLENMRNEMESSEENQRDDFQLRGFSLKNEAPSLVKALGDLIERTDDDGVALENQPQFSAHDYLKTLCDGAICVAQRIFGKSIGVKMLYLNWKHGLNASHLTNENAAHIEEEEIDSFLRVASDFPLDVWPAVGDRRMVKYERGIQMRSRYGGLSLANSKMEFFDGWTRLDKNEKDLVTAHEIGHVIGQASGVQLSGRWLELSGWERMERGWTATKPESLLSQHSALSPHEDFAESVNAYRYAPDELINASPAKYRFLKEFVFLGREFRTKQQCGE